MKILKIIIILLLSSFFLLWPFFGEPYPAIILPGFTGTFNGSEKFVKVNNQKIVIEFQQEKVEISPVDLFHNVRKGHQGLAFQSVLQTYSNNIEVPSSKVYYLLGLSFKRERKNQKNIDKKKFETWIDDLIQKKFDKKPLSVLFISEQAEFHFKEKELKETNNTNTVKILFND